MVTPQNSYSLNGQIQSYEIQSYEYIFYSLQGQDVGFHCFIAFLNFPRLCFISLDTSAHTFGPRNLKLSVPLKTE